MDRRLTRRLSTIAEAQPVGSLTAVAPAVASVEAVTTVEAEESIAATELTESFETAQPVAEAGISTVNLGAIESVPSEMELPPTQAEEADREMPLPELATLVGRLSPNVRELLDDLFRARFVSVERIPKSVLK